MPAHFKGVRKHSKTTIKANVIGTSMELCMFTAK